ncbi:MAG: Holliday junction branch migration protein RuvA [Chitinispirillaceae bacterium]|nr:Holliday junction branch migration protein RuvA [Chitinispirillaceae bacterium]
MIGYVRGTLTEKEPSIAAVEANGVGYEINVPLSTYERLPAQGAEVKLYTHYHVREDAHKLYGFLTKTERELFRQLIGVSSIGPKTAMGVLSKVSVDELAKSIALGDPSRLTKIPGIGAKIAQRLIMELRGRITVPARGAASAALPSSGADVPVSDTGSEAFQALISLGYNDKQVAHAIGRVRQTLAEEEADIPVEEWIKKALQVI